MAQKPSTGSQYRVDADTIEAVAERHSMTAVELAEAVKSDLEYTRVYAEEVIEQRPIVEEHDDYLVARASDSATIETPLPVIDVYRAVADLDATDYVAAGFPLIVPRDALDQ